MYPVKIRPLAKKGCGQRIHFSRSTDLGRTGTHTLGLLEYGIHALAGIGPA